MDQKEHSGHRKRLRERVRSVGIEHWQGYQVLEYALTFVMPYKDTNVIAHRLINKYETFAAVLEADEEELAQVDGVGEVTAHFLSNLKNIFHYYEKDRIVKNITVISPNAVHEFVKYLFKGKLVEQLYLVCISPKNQILSVDKIAEGTSSEATINMRFMLERIFRTKVNSVVIAHNHPKGDVTPSDSDHKFTKALITNLGINSCHLLDHIIIGEDDNEYYSYRQSGMLDKFKEEVASIVDFKSIAQPPARYEVD